MTFEFLSDVFAGDQGVKRSYQRLEVVATVMNALPEAVDSKVLNKRMAGILSLIMNSNFQEQDTVQLSKILQVLTRCELTDTNLIAVMRAGLHLKR